MEKGVFVSSVSFCFNVCLFDQELSLLLIDDRNDKIRKFQNLFVNTYLVFFVKLFMAIIDVIIIKKMILIQ